MNFISTHQHRLSCLSQFNFNTNSYFYPSDSASSGVCGLLLSPPSIQSFKSSYSSIPSVPYISLSCHRWGSFPFPCPSSSLSSPTCIPNRSNIFPYLVLYYPFTESLYNICYQPYSADQPSYFMKQCSINLNF